MSSEALYQRLIHEAKMQVSLPLVDVTYEKVVELLGNGHGVYPEDCDNYIVPPYNGGRYEIYRYVGASCMRGNDVVFCSPDRDTAVAAFLRYVFCSGA